MKLDLSVVVLTYNEEIHLQRCLESVSRVADEIFVVDCFSSDQTVVIAEVAGAKVFQHAWPGNQAAQFNWALENLPIQSKWILRLDADEYLMPELIEEIKIRLIEQPEDVTGIVFKRRHIFLERWIKRGTYPIKLLRLFKRGKAVCEQRLMDEHIELLEGRAVEFEHDFVDHNLNDLGWWTQKHVGYAFREALDMLDIELGLLGHAQGDGEKKLGEQAKAKRLKKHKYARMPLFWRAFLYFVMRYIFKGGFLEGREGFLWHFLQGWWYRTLVDARIFEIKQVCGNDVGKIKAYLKTRYGVDCDRANPFDR